MPDSISISDMAKLHGITRQTLIYYDNIDLFKPARIDANGYRYYSWKQIPYLREICFLKRIGVSLKDIVKHFHERTPETEMELLHEQKRYIERQIGQLHNLRESINMRLNLYEQAVDADIMHLREQPFMQYLPERKIIFQEYIQPINKENLHLTIMKLWQEIFRTKSLPPTSSFGSILRKKAILEGNAVEGGGSCVFIPVWDTGNKYALTIPAGEYACMYKYGMPYDARHIYYLVNWMGKHNLELAGDIIDVCLLDTTFYSKHHELDFCLLQAPVRHKDMNL